MAATSTTTATAILKSVGGSLSEVSSNPWVLGGVASFATLALVYKCRVFPRFNANLFYWRVKAITFVSLALDEAGRKLKSLVGVPLEPRGDTTEFDPQWMQKVLEEYAGCKLPKLERVEIIKGDISGGFSGKMFRVEPIWADEAPVIKAGISKRFIIKAMQHQFESYYASSLLGNGREGIFYQWATSNGLLQSLNHFIPRVYYSSGSTLSGAYLVGLEDLALKNAVVGGVMMGNQCWGAVELPPSVAQDPVFVMETIFLSTAEIHARFWRDKSLLKPEMEWLKCVSMWKGGDRDCWETAKLNLQNRWNKILRAVATKETAVPYSEKYIHLMNSALKQTTWKTFRENFDLNDPSTPFTLCHGDYHAGNTLWCPASKELNISEPEVFLVDWQGVGVSCPFTEIAQFIISHAPIELRRRCEKDLFRKYYNKLIEKGVDSSIFTFESCWNRYKVGGIERWLQMNTIMADLALRKIIPDPAMTWFYRQVESFIEDHINTIESPIILMSVYCYI